MNRNNYNKQYKIQNKEKIQEQRKQYRVENKEELKVLEDYYNNKERYIESRKTYYSENKEYINSYNRDYYQIYKEDKSKLIKDDTHIILRKSVSNSINKALKSNSSSKNGISCLKYLSYTILELKFHLESLFEPWMNWSNWGIYDKKSWNDKDPSTWKWNIDHIIPQSKLPYKSMEDENFKRCWDLSNLRPYSAKQNILDGNRKNRGKK